MGAISIEKVNHLFWLGRYTERVFTTLRKFYRVYDSMLDFENPKEIYSKYCNRLSIPDIYENGKVFVDSYLFEEENPDSMYSNMQRAYDNAVVLRDELSSKALSYIQMALDTLKMARHQSAPLFALQPVMDDLFAFWGCVDDYMDNEECRNIMKVGKRVERLDLYLRMDYHVKDVEKEFSKMVNRMKKTSIHYDVQDLKRLTAIIEEESWKEDYHEAINCLAGIVEVI